MINELPPQNVGVSSNSFHWGGKAELTFSDGAAIVAVYKVPVMNDAFAAETEFSCAL
jgi:hypothetical protein